MEVTSNILIGDVREQLRTLAPKSVHCCVTSPPYFGLRDYGTATWKGGDADCDHRAPDEAGTTKKHTAGQREHAGRFAGANCHRCGAVRIDGQLGLEKTPADYVAGMVEVFREVWRVLRDDGTVWLNIGDSYVAPNGRSSGGTYGRGPNSQLAHMHEGQEVGIVRNWGNLPAKNLLGIPWRLAFALQDAGWIIRSEIIWRKPSPMPESVTDRPTKSHEQVFLLTKNERYFYDAVAIAEDTTGRAVFGNSRILNHDDRNDCNRQNMTATTTRNKRSVWTISTRSFRGAHFACFPPDLVEPCILAGTSAHGCCSACGSPWQRITNRTKLKRDRPNDFTKRTGEDGTGNSCSNSVAGVSVETLGWEPACKCSAEVVPCTVLDPFSGSGTTGAVANVLGRNYVGTELNADYAAMWDMRLADVRNWWAKKNGKKPVKRKVISARQGDLFLGANL